MSTIQEKKKLIEVKKEEIKRLEEEIAKCTLEEQNQPTSPPTIVDQFPIGSRVRLVGRNEKLYLRRKKATVIDHTEKTVLLKRKGEIFRRFPTNLKRIDDDNKEEEGTGSS